MDMTTSPASKTNQDLIWGSVFGAAIGDALGFPFEFMLRDQIHAAAPFGPIHYRATKTTDFGEVSDDTYMSLAVLEGVRAQNLSVIEERFQDWYRSERFWPSVPGIATTQALRDRSPVPSEGNGACMKAHISALYLEDMTEAVQHAIRVAQLTHTSQELGHNEVAIAFVVLGIKYAMSQPANPNLEAFIEFATSNIHVLAPEFHDFFHQNLITLRNIVLDHTHQVSGWSVDTANYAIRTWLTYPEDFLSCVRTAVLLGGDTDTTATVVGALSGAYVGFNNLPKHLLEPLNVREEILALVAPNP